MIKNMNKFLIQATGIFIALLLQVSCADGPNRNMGKNLFVTQTSLEMIAGDEVQIVASPTSQTFTWTSSNPAVAKVSSAGLVTAVSDGTCIILVVSSEGLRREIPVDVTAYMPLEGIEVYNPKNLAIVTELPLLLGQSVTLSANPLPKDYNEKIPFNVVWKSSDPNIVTVDAKTGAVKAVDFGHALITVSSVEKPSVKTDIPVSIDEIPITEIQAPANLDLVLDQTVTVTPTLLPANYSVKDKSLNWASSDGSVVTVSATGEVKAIATGSATITISLNANPSVKKIIPVTVKIPFINISAFTDAGSNLVYSRVNLAKGKQINVTGITSAEIAVAYNRDFMSYDGTTLTFTGESGAWDIYYSSVYHYFWVIKNNATEPECLWSRGSGFTNNPVWYSDFAGSWGTGFDISRIRSSVYLKPMGNGKYQGSVFLKQSLGMVIIGNLTAWNQRYGYTMVDPVPPGIIINANKSDIQATAALVEGYYLFIVDISNMTYQFIKY